MSYTPNTWQKGDVVTSAKLNNIEQGIANAGGILIVNSAIDEQTEVTTLDKTWQEIYDAPVAFVTVEDSTEKSWSLIESVYEDGGAYTVVVGAFTYTAESANDYPVLDGEK